MATTRQDQINAFVGHLNILRDLGYTVPTEIQINALKESDMGMDYIVKTNAYMRALHGERGDAGYRAEMKTQLDAVYQIPKLEERELVQARMEAFRIERQTHDDYHQYEVTTNKQQAVATEIQSVYSTFQATLKEYQKNCISSMATLTAGFYDEENNNLYNHTEESYKDMLRKGAEIKRDREKKLTIKIHGLSGWNAFRYDALYNQSAKQRNEAIHTVATVYDIKAEEKNNSVTYTFGGPAWVFHLLATPEERLQFFVLLYEDIVDRHYQRPIFDPNPNEKLKFQLATARDFLRAQMHVHRTAMQDSRQQKSTLPFVELSPAFIERMEKEIEKKRKEENINNASFAGRVWSKASSWIFSGKDPSDLSADEMEKQLNDIKRSQSEIRFLTGRADTLEERKVEDQKQEEKVELQKADRQYNQALQEIDLNNPDKQVHRLEKLYEPIKENTEAESDASLMLEIKRQKALPDDQKNNEENTKKKQKLISETEKKYHALCQQAQQSPGNNETNQKTIADLVNDLSTNIVDMYATRDKINKHNREIILAQLLQKTAERSLLSAKHELNAATQAIAALHIEDQQYRTQNEQLSIANQELARQATQIQNNITMSEEQLTQQQGQLNALQAEVVLERQQLEELRQQSQQSQEQINTLNEEITQHEQEIQDVDLRIGALADQINLLSAPAPSANEEENQPDPEVDEKRNNLQQQMIQLTQEQQRLEDQLNELTRERERLTVEHEQQQQEYNERLTSIAEKERSLTETTEQIGAIERELTNQGTESQRIQEEIGVNQQAILTNQQRLAVIPEELSARRTEVQNQESVQQNQEKKLKEKTSILRAEETEHAVLNRELSELQKGIKKIKNQLLTIDPQKRAERLVWLQWLKSNGINEMLETPGDILTAVPNEFRTQYGAELGYNRLVKYYAEKAETVKKSFDKLLSKNNKDQFKKRLYNLYQELASGNISPAQYHADIKSFREEFEQYKSELNKMNETVEAMIAFCQEIDPNMPENPKTDEEKALFEDYNSLRRTLFSMTAAPELIENGEGLTGPEEALQTYIDNCNNDLPYQKEREELQKRVNKMRYKNKARDIVPYSLASLQRQFKEEDGSSAAVEDAMALNKELSGALDVRNVLASCNIDENDTALDNARVNNAVTFLNALQRQTAENQQPISLYSGVSSFEPREGLGLELQRIEETLEACYSNAQQFYEELKALDQARLALERRYTDNGNPINRDDGGEYGRQVSSLQQHALRIQLQLVEISAVAEVAKNRYKRLTPENCPFPYFGGNADGAPAVLKYHEIHAPRINRLFYYLSGGDTYRREPVTADEQRKTVPVLSGTDPYDAAGMFQHGNHATADVNAPAVQQAANAVVPDTNSYRYYQQP